MTTAICSKCGAVVQFEGLMAGCPSCGALIRATAATGATSATPQQEPIDHLPEIPEEPIAMPAPVHVDEKEFSARRKKDVPLGKIIWGAIGVAAACGIFVSWLLMLVRGPTVEVIKVVEKVPVKVPAATTQLEGEPPAEPSRGAPSNANQPSPPPSSGVPGEGVRGLIASALPATTQAVVEIPKIHPQMRKPSHQFNDDDVEAAIKRAAEFMIAQFPAKQLKGADSYDADTYAGLNALCVYSLLVAGQDTGDPRLDVRGDFMKGLIERMKAMPMDGGKATYSRSLRATALAVFNRPEDRSKLEEDAKWLMKASMQGAWDYSMPPAGAKRETNRWDNSNSQYGALGVWAAANAGLPIPAQFWSDIENHWADCQGISGGWSYQRNGGANLSMTAAGVNMLFVASDQQGISRFARKGRTGIAEVIERGLAWLDEGSHSVDDSSHPGYTRYSLERVGLASGYKFFGEHDWYRELAEKAAKNQNAAGYWEGGDGTPAETAFTLLFLCRGRMPVFASKLRWDGNWNGHRRNLQNESNYLSKQLERAITWQVADVDRDFKDWTNAPVLMISSSDVPNLKAKDLENIRSYVESGGMLFTQAENGSAAFNTFAQDLAKNLFPQYEMKELAEDHPIYSSVVGLKQDSAENSATKVALPVKLMGVSNGARLLMVHSPTDVTGKWTKNVLARDRGNFDFGLNLFVYAAGKREFRHRLDSPLIAPPTEPPVGTVTVARVKYEGNWDPEPGAWRREARLIERDTGVHIDVKEMDPARLVLEKPVMAHVVVNAGVNPDPLREYVSNGGVLIVENWGNKLELINEDQLMALDSSIGNNANVRMGRIGKGVVFVCTKNLSTGMLDCHALGTNAMAPKKAEELVEKILLMAIR